MAQQLGPAPYQPDQFVNREEELELIRRRVEQGRSGQPIQTCVMHFRGMPRIGKTWLLSHLAHQYRYVPEAMPATRGVFSILLDCSTLPEGSSLEKELMQQAQHELRATLKDQMPEAPPDSMTDLAELLAELTAVFVPLLLLDAAEVLSDPNFQWIEEELLVPLARTGQVILVVSGQGNRPQWTQIETRRRLEKCALRPLDVDETAEQVRKVGIAAPVTQMHPYSGGHPLATWLLTQAADQLADESQVSTLLLTVENQLLRSLPQETQVLVRVISVLRWFGIAPMRTLLSEAVDPVYGQRSDSFYLDTLDVLRQRGLGDYTGHGFELAPAARRILKQRLRLSNPDLYRQAQRTAIELYEQWMDAYPEDCGRFFQEVIYHKTELWASMDKPEESLRIELTSLLQQRLTQNNFTLNQLHELLRILRHDQELIEVMPTSVYRRMCRYFEEFIIRPRVAHRTFGALTGGVSC